ncbi:hypothetical protein ACQ4M4_06265 [Leptolyngbya sp. AN02str]|uniref:hypothetical protein n=1 Tax=Leptolyngbya sp. AN02str TaxID=3423363 RepID=UPI003D31FF37
MDFPYENAENDYKNYRLDTNMHADAVSPIAIHHRGLPLRKIEIIIRSFGFRQGVNAHLGRLCQNDAIDFSAGSAIVTQRWGTFPDTLATRYGSDRPKLALQLLAATQHFSHLISRHHFLSGCRYVAGFHGDRSTVAQTKEAESATLSTSSSRCCGQLDASVA